MLFFCKLKWYITRANVEWFVFEQPRAIYVKSWIDTSGWRASFDRAICCSSCCWSQSSGESV